MEDRMLSDEILLGIINAKSGGGGGGTSNYNDLSNQPQINGNTLVGNKSASDLGLVAAVNGKGLSTNDYTDADNAIVGGVTAALAGKQGVLTAGKYIDIDENNEISVDPVVPNEAFTYTIQQIGDGIVKITKTVSGAVVFEKTYNGNADITLDALHYVYSNGVQSYTLLIASDTHEAGFKQSMSWWARDTFTENFSTVDHSGEKLIIKSEMDDALALKQDKTDNSLQTTDKTVVGAVNELKSGLTNVADDVKLNTQDLTTTSRTKNIAPMTLDNLKYYNSAGTWTDNVYVYEGITYTVNTDNDGNISSIGVNGTASGTYSHLSVWLNIIKAGSYKMNGAPTGNDYYLQLYRSGILDIKCKGSDTDVVLASDVTSVAFRIIVMGGVTADNLTYYPMLRLATESATYTPYIHSVNSRLETVESGAFKSIKKIKSDGVKTYSNIFSELFSDITGSAKYYILYNNTIFTMSAKTSQSATFSRIIYSSNTIYVSALLIRSNSSATFTEAEITANGVTYNDYSTDVMPANSNVELVM